MVIILIGSIPFNVYGSLMFILTAFFYDLKRQMEYKIKTKKLNCLIIFIEISIGLHTSSPTQQCHRVAGMKKILKINKKI